MPASRTSTLISAGLVVVGLIAPSRGATLRVPEDFPTIQSCIDAAASGMDECIVAAGTYHEAIDYLGKSVSIRSAEGSKVTIIDATGLGSSVVTCINGEDSSAVLEGFTITGGTGTLFAGDVSGGGMLNFDSTPTIVDCIFRDNTAYVGGGMYNHIFANPTLIRCSFINNEAHVGGGIFNLESNPALTDCSFIGNSASDGGGGAIGSQLYCTPTLTNCLFRENDAYLGGALYNDWDCYPIIANCTFVNNTAFRGGGIYSSLESVPTLDHCVFSGNSATADGGAIGDEYYAGVSAKECTFEGNTAMDWGGAVFNGSWEFLGDQTLFVDCTFSNNKAGSGGGFFNDENCRATIHGCKFDGNTAIDGGGIYNRDDAILSLTDCQFTGNSAQRGGGEFNIGRTSLANCIFKGNDAVTFGGGISNPYEPYSAGAITVVDTSFQDNHAHDGVGIPSTNSIQILNPCRAATHLDCAESPFRAER